MLPDFDLGHVLCNVAGEDPCQVLDKDLDIETSWETYLLANDMWQVKHLKGLTLVSAKVMSTRVRGGRDCFTGLTSKNMSLEVLISGKRVAAVSAKDHPEGDTEDSLKLRIMQRCTSKETCRYCKCIIVV